jgi:hypothetical protein
MSTGRTGQIFRIAAQLMRPVPVDHARARHRAARLWRLRISLNEEMAIARSRDVNLIVLDELNCLLSLMQLMITHHCPLG